MSNETWEAGQVELTVLGYPTIKNLLRQYLEEHSRRNGAPCPCMVCADTRIRLRMAPVRVSFRG